MKKLFTLVCMAFVAMSVNAQETLPENVYPLKSITMGDIKWQVKNNRTDINDEAGTKFYIVMGEGNAYKNIYCEHFYSEDKADYVTRPFYTYVYYWQEGVTGFPSYGLYYKFTPSKDGKLKVKIWANKGNRATTVVPASTGKPLAMHTDYLVEGYINGKSKNTTTPIIDETTGEQKKDNDGNPMWVQEMIFFDNAEIKAIHDETTNPWAGKTEPTSDGSTEKKWDYVIAGGNQSFWGWLTFDVKAGESYYVFQASSQLGFGGYDFTPAGGETESYVAALDKEGTIVMNEEFANNVDENGVANNVVDGNSVISISTANMNVEATGSGTPTAVEPDLGPSSISSFTMEAQDANAPMYNLAGQKVDSNFKGIVLQNGKKMVVK